MSLCSIEAQGQIYLYKPHGAKTQKFTTSKSREDRSAVYFE